MTPEERDALNVELAQRLFGIDTESPCDRCGGGHTAWSCYETPDYAGTWEGCGRVIEAMRARVPVRWLVLDEYQTCWRACFRNPDVKNEPRHGWSQGHTAPEAVARACLEALGQEVGT